jgi:signal transduction histidine kinase
MPNGGKLTMSAKTDKDRRIALMVEDTGIGIPADKLDRIFDLYFTTKPEGSGIGLSIVYRIAQLHGGEIEVVSTEGRGTTFRLWLPLA